ncbi:enoyl-[acyl-carrier-protein] reductase FabK [Clostridium cochlearium]|uniref:Probable nitronate monooxygenase n=1 Tax=Clostridium cochlearium TaxID=1494 RepID=A0A240B3Y2_CLOCO|nr:enoyl-[acyl-carrier-protein] reductase FabK [Clostridium cochlearium]MBE6065614.1 enoyl-[acyl-carrier-protein] reductase FabK [Clostridium cochlearium]MBU5270233.1 enoyl-[acyl-carrier-protein] reductase FabK [Clostridium cochlearium]MCR1972077.1 enoyl-[acyl-carrier-protein] reductase FabK [Clostridium cochlearium]MDU1442874.1 enoyl-[acyl-carrier-protein] reductase FabK [Clostridium cochlearium]NMA57142.1 enoyl-[acyl-carrier-protein] reductase FabK [Clostridium cochlearium]
MKKNAFCNMIGVNYPIIQGAMAWIADSSLASAVSNAGGLGIIASGNQPIDIVKEEIRKTKELTKKPFGLNIMLLSDNAEELAKLVCEENIKVVTTGAGNPGKYIDMWKKNNVKVIPVVASVALAKRMERAGADAVIVEGCEAGGHIGELTTMALLPQVVDAVNIPVIAAGGIGDKRGVLAAFMLGAVGVQVGTRFLVAKECNVHKNYKEKVLGAKDIDTVVTGRNTGHPVRVLRNRLTRQYQVLEKENAPMDEFEKITKGALIKAVKEGDIQTGSLMAGQIAGLICKEQSCKEIIEEMFDFKEVIKGLENLYE